MNQIILTATVDLIAGFCFYASAINRNAWVKVRNALTMGAMDHSYLLSDERYIQSCRFQAVSAALIVCVSTVFLVKMVLQAYF